MPKPDVLIDHLTNFSATYDGKLRVDVAAQKSYRKAINHCEREKEANAALLELQLKVVKCMKLAFEKTEFPESIDVTDTQQETFRRLNLEMRLDRFVQLPMSKFDEDFRRLLDHAKIYLDLAKCWQDTASLRWDRYWDCFDLNKF